MEFRNWQKAQDLLSDLRHRSGALDAGEHLPPYVLVQFSLSFDLLHPLAGGPSVDGASYSRDRRIFLLLLMGDDLHNSTQPWQTARYQEATVTRSTFSFGQIRCTTIASFVSELTTTETRR